MNFRQVSDLLAGREDPGRGTEAANLVEDPEPGSAAAAKDSARRGRVLFENGKWLDGSADPLKAVRRAALK